MMNIDFEWDVNVLRYRKLITELEFITSQSKHDLYRYGQWYCDYNSAYQEIKREIEQVEAFLYKGDPK